MMLSKVLLPCIRCKRTKYFYDSVTLDKTEKLTRTSIGFPISICSSFTFQEKLLFPFLLVTRIGKKEFNWKQNRKICESFPFFSVKSSFDNYSFTNKSENCWIFASPTFFFLLGMMSILLSIFFSSNMTIFQLFIYTGKWAFIYLRKSTHPIPSRETNICLAQTLKNVKMNGELKRSSQF